MFYDWQPNSKTSIVNCVKGYSAPYSVSNILYRIWNAIKSIFHRSDWQLARDDVLAGVAQATGNVEISVEKKHSIAKVILCSLIEFQRTSENTYEDQMRLIKMNLTKANLPEVNWEYRTSE